MARSGTLGRLKLRSTTAETPRRARFDRAKHKVSPFRRTDVTPCGPAFGRVRVRDCGRVGSPGLSGSSTWVPWSWRASATWPSVGAFFFQAVAIAPRLERVLDVHRPVDAGRPRRRRHRARGVQGGVGEQGLHDAAGHRVGGPHVVRFGSPPTMTSRAPRRSQASSGLARSSQRASFAAVCRPRGEPDQAFRGCPATGIPRYAWTTSAPARSPVSVRSATP